MTLRAVMLRKARSSDPSYKAFKDGTAPGFSDGRDANPAHSGEVYRAPVCKVASTNSYVMAVDLNT